MMKRWIGAALAMFCFGVAPAAQAQFAPPQVLPEPVPYANGIAPAFNPHASPPPPVDDAHGPSPFPGAFQDQAGPGTRGLYFYTGAIALQRERLGHGPISLDDRRSNGLDTGIPPPPNSTLILDFSNVHPDYHWGERATLGFMDGCHAIEVSGFYIQDANDSATAVSRGRLSSWFTNAPLGFEGDNGMFLQDDVVRATLRTAMGSAEINSRWKSPSCWGVEWLIGVRYVDLQEEVYVYAGDDDVTVRDVFGRPDPLREATYFVRSHNHIAAPQVGADWSRPILSWITIGANAKGAIGPNFVDFDKRLTRGDGLVGFSRHESETTYSHVYEAGVYADLGVAERVRVRMGYNALLFLHVPDAQSQVSYDFRKQFPGNKNDGSIFYHGPIMEVQILF